MASSESTLLKLELQAVGENDSTWGTKANAVFSRLEEAVAGETSITLASSDVTLTDTAYVTNEARKMHLNIGGTITTASTINIVVPERTKLYTAYNGATASSAQPVVVKTTATSGTGATVSNGKFAVLWCDGTDVHTIFDQGAYLSSTNTYLSATNTYLTTTGNLSDVSTASDARTNLGLQIGVNVQAYDADILKADTTDNLEVGFTTTEYAHGTVSTGTVTLSFANPCEQTLTNGGAFTLAPPSSGTGGCDVWVTNASTAGTITTTDFTKVAGSTYATTNGKKYLFQVKKSSVASILNVVEIA